MKRILLSLGVGLICSVSALAAPLGNYTTCDNVAIPGEGGLLNGRLSDFIGAGRLADGCIDQDKIYYGFTYTGTPAANRVAWSIAFSPNFPQLGSDEHTVSFLATWTSPFSIGYTMEVYQPTSARAITRATVDLAAPPTGLNLSSISMSITPDASPAQVITAEIAAPAAANVFAQKVIVAITGTPSGGNISALTTTFTQTVVPEPATYAFLGSGLLALALVRRRGSK